LGHYKILQQLNIYNKQNENVSIKILTIHYNLITNGAKLGETLPRW
jgi:hypothetical protein